ncbi:hypothetical protein SAY86_001568 [Trapa natans]|uniref:Synaptonemal complex protein 1-like n=1 Tax=Trapa natans TaxID=22666 RepID=A0AAN7MW80_TRANT|nr:hypothetical protein SAY86_001568 [Trapa natans]
MQKIGFPSMKSLDQLKSLSGLSSGVRKAFSFSSRSTSDSLAMGSFANLKITAGYIGSVRLRSLLSFSITSNLLWSNTKLEKSMGLVRTLEEKLQNAFNENAKLKVKHKEDEKLWKGLESKFSSTKAFCEQLSETLQILAVQIQNAEKDKEFFKDKISTSSAALDILNQQMIELSLKLESAEEAVRIRDKEVIDLKTQMEEGENFFRDEQNRMTDLIKEKDSIIKKNDASLEANGIAMESLNSQLSELHTQLHMKDNEIKCLMDNQEKLDEEKNDLQLSKDELVSKLASSVLEIKTLEDVVHLLTEQLVALNVQSLAFLEKNGQLNSMHESSWKLVEEKMDLTDKLSQKRYEQLLEKHFCLRAEKDVLHLANMDSNDKVIELEKAHEASTAKLSEENRLARGRIQLLETEVKNLVCKKMEAESLIAKLEENITSLSETARCSKNMTEDFLLKVSSLETQNKDNNEKFLAELQRKIEHIETLQVENQKHEQREDMLGKKVNHLHSILEEKEQLILQHKEREKKLEDQISENQGLLTAAESKLVELGKQYDAMFESKQLELSRHLKELCQRNDQAINDIRRKYEVEKQDIIKEEKDKVEKMLGEMERKYEKQLAECREESKKNLIHVHEEHAAKVHQIEQENNWKESILKNKHNEELKLAQLHAENELRERTTMLRNEHEAQMKATRCQHDDECWRLQEELKLQKSREDRQRALLQLQWRVMSDKPQDDQEIHPRKEYSISSIKMRNSDGSKSRKQRSPRGSDEDEEQDLPLPEAAQTPVSKLLRKVQNVDTRNMASIPKHGKKRVTRREYDVEMSNGRTITKRRKTKSTVMLEDPRKHKHTISPAIGGTIKNAKVIKSASRPRARASNIGDLFSEGSLNPYTDDPYAFD